jgi:hypothetical protein
VVFAESILSGVGRSLGTPALWVAALGTMTVLVMVAAVAGKLRQRLRLRVELDHFRRHSH